jgi:ankyrin repeat protein
MLKSGTDPSIRTNFNWDPLHWAANNGNLEFVKLLVSAGADVNPISDQNTTPLDLAINENQLAIIEVLSRAGAKRKQEPPSATLDLRPAYHLVKRDPRAESNNESRTTSAVTAKDNQSLPKFSLIFDQPIHQSTSFGQYIYFPDESADKLDLPFYQISRPLDTRTQEISIKHAYSRPTMEEYPLRANISFPRTFSLKSFHL